MYQLNRAAGFGWYEPIEHLLQLHRDRPAIAKPCGLVDYHADGLALLLSHQYFDGCVSVGQRGRLGRSHNNDLGSQGHGEQHNVRDACTRVQQNHVVVGYQTIDDAQKVVADVGCQA